MPSEEKPPPPSEETRLLREEVAAQKAEKEARERREALSEELKNRVSVAAIILTTALSFIGNVKGDRADAASSAKSAANEARRQGAELWAYYQTKLAERTSLEIARDRVHLDLSRRGLARQDPEAMLDAFRLTGYEERIRDFDTETQRVFYRVQDLEKQEDVSQRAAIEPGRAVTRYELGTKLITLALILLSVTILSNKRYLLWAGVTLGSIGLLVSLDAYFLFL
jgi:ATP/maltotriose-dependent transcriptional regulator MalT